MTQAQENFKKAIAYRKKTGCSSKEAFAFIKENKPTKTKKLGALPIGFVGTFFDISFKIINQFDIYNNVNSIIEDKKNGNVITTITGNQNSLVNTDMFLNYAKRNSQYSVKEWDSIKSKINKFFKLIKKEVKNYNSGKSKTIKKQPIKILASAKFVKTEVKKTRQNGVSNIQYDKMKQALPAGKRTSASGKVYYENRRNRSDAGVLLGLSINKPNFENFKTVGSEKNNKDFTQYFLDNDAKLFRTQNQINFLIGIRKNIQSDDKKTLEFDILRHKKLLSELKKHKTELKKLL